MMMRSFLEAFKERYLDTGDNVDLEVFTIKPTEKYTKQVVVELVGREKAIDTFRNLKNLRQIVLANCSIRSMDQEDNESKSSAADVRIANEELKTNLKSNRSIQSLDISYNQINSWSEIIKIVELFPYLQELILSGNPLQSIELDNLDWQVKVLSSITDLIAGRLKIDWLSIESFDKLFVNLKSLNIFDNNLIDIKLNDFSSFENLECLSLSENRVGWSNVLKLKQMRNLKHVQLSNCGLTMVVLDEPNLFSNVRKLNLGENQIGKWSDIAELSKLENLIDLSIRENPLFTKENYDQAFNFTCAILKNLRVLNRQVITGEKRRDAEIYFLRINYRQWLNGELEAWNVKKRFQELIECYGEPVDLLEDVQIKKFLNITLTDQRKKIRKKLLKTMNISTLRMLVRRLFDLDNNTEFELWYSNGAKGDLKSKLDQNEQDLKFYSMDDNAIIEVLT